MVIERTYNYKQVDGRIVRRTIRFRIDEDGLKKMADKAVGNKGGKSKDGPVTAECTGSTFLL